jgi:hypothetical protein
MTDRLIPLETLYTRFDAFATGKVRSGKGWDAHEAVLDRLAANQRVAEEYGWTSCALERAGGMGRLTAWGIPPQESQRHLIPDWPPEPR